MNVTRVALALGLSLTMVAVIAGKGPKRQLVILDAQVDLAAPGGPQLTVTGMNFGTAEPWVILGGTTVLDVVSHTDTEIVVKLDPALAPGTYLLSIMGGLRRADRSLGRVLEASESLLGHEAQRSIGCAGWRSGDTSTRARDPQSRNSPFYHGLLVEHCRNPAPGVPLSSRLPAEQPLNRAPIALFSDRPRAPRSA